MSRRRISNRALSEALFALAESEPVQRRLWARAEKALRNLQVPSARIARILEVARIYARMAWRSPELRTWR